MQVPDGHHPDFSPRPESRYLHERAITIFQMAWLEPDCAVLEVQTGCLPPMALVSKSNCQHQVVLGSALHCFQISPPSPKYCYF